MFLCSFAKINKTQTICAAEVRARLCSTWRLGVFRYDWRL